MMRSIVLTAAIGVVLCGPAAAADRANVLFIAIDDVRDHLGCLDVSHAKTPNLDALAARGRLFSHHYVQVPTCGASRCALLRGNYPSVRAQVGNGAIAATSKSWSDASLPALFRQNGYQTFALGKITHHPGGRTGKLWADGPEELPGAWDRCWIPESPWGEPERIMHGYANGVARSPGKSPPWQAFDGPDESFPDAWVASEAVRTLKQLAASDEPWFFAVGFFKPHLPFAAPQRWFDIHDADAIPAPEVTSKPEGISSWHGSGEFRGNYGHDGRDPASDAEYAKLMRHAYAAATSYMDAQVGRVLAELDRLGLADNTIVVAWGDHGFLLGEHAIWGKHCLYEEALRSPLIIRQPGMTRAGEPSAAVVETVDIYPTLADLCGLAVPERLAGQSLRSQLADPAAPTTKPAHGFWGADQRTIRTDRWRLIVHTRRDSTEPAFELFDYENDPHESRNVADENPNIVQKLGSMLDRLPTVSK